ncbi:MAG: hypothetical protein [Wendovervirus sonii]|uniref:Uncharacterized protein n=1 Tax=phage Lak_Megaphage_Sonny TaxID=3109229 RepID=A0ABZ0Z735_9CAUD|nr:MAG: hypothetical protein [phage Lak_Megaphage_Sonny]
MDSIKDIKKGFQEIDEMQNRIKKINSDICDFVKARAANLLIGKVIKERSNQFLIIKNVSSCYHANINKDDKFYINLTATRRMMTNPKFDKLGFFEDTPDVIYNVTIKLDIENEKLNIDSNVRFVDDAEYEAFLTAFEKRRKIVDKNGNTLSLLDKVVFMHNGEDLIGNVGDTFDIDTKTIQIYASKNKVEATYEIPCNECTLI